ncbi:hypothetical protein BDW67DRAFT_172475 [Aspergillus spinulosporus]
MPSQQIERCLPNYSVISLKPSIFMIQTTLPILSREARLLPLTSRCYSYQRSRSHIANIVGNPQDFFDYTGGRWVWDEKQSYNKSFKLTKADGKVVVSRIPTPNAGPVCLTHSLRNMLHLPVHEHALGKNLADVWTDMDLERKVQIMEDIVGIQHKLLSLKFFNRYEFLFYRKDAPPGSCPAIVEGDQLLHEHKNNIAERFWSFSVDYIKALALRETAWIQKHANPHSPNDPIFVDNTGHITSIIDWQSTWAGPLFLEGRHSHFLDYHGELVLELPENFKQLHGNMQTAMKDKVTKSILLYLYERVFQYPNGKTLTDPLCRKYMGRRYLTAARVSNKSIEVSDVSTYLILRTKKIRRKWDLLGHIARCPVDFSSEEIRKHREDGGGWNEVQDFWNALSVIKERDGWASHATYDQAVSIHSQILAEVSSHSNDKV